MEPPARRSLIPISALSRPHPPCTGPIRRRASPTAPEARSLVRTSLGGLKAGPSYAEGREAEIGVPAEADVVQGHVQGGLPLGARCGGIGSFVAQPKRRPE